MYFAVPSAMLAFFMVLIDDVNEDFRKDWRLLDFNAGMIWSATTVSITMVLGFRTNKAWQRFWEGTTLLHQMRGEWFDSVSCLAAFSFLAKKTKPSEVAEFRHTLVRLMSLCHASALEEISSIGGK